MGKTGDYWRVGTDTDLAYNSQVKLVKEAIPFFSCGGGSPLLSWSFCNLPISFLGWSRRLEVWESISMFLSQFVVFLAFITLSLLSRIFRQNSIWETKDLWARRRFSLLERMNALPLSEIVQVWEHLSFVPQFAIWERVSYNSGGCAEFLVFSIFFSIIFLFVITTRAKVRRGLFFWEISLAFIWEWEKKASFVHIYSVGSEQRGSNGLSCHSDV